MTTTLAINYQELLLKYMKLVNDAEGCDFVDPIDARMHSDVKFKDCEWESLKKMSNEIKNTG